MPDLRDALGTGRQFMDGYSDPSHTPRGRVRVLNWMSVLFLDPHNQTSSEPVLSCQEVTVLTSVATRISNNDGIHSWPCACYTFGSLGTAPGCSCAGIITHSAGSRTSSACFSQERKKDVFHSLCSCSALGSWKPVPLRQWLTTWRFHLDQCFLFFHHFRRVWRNVIISVQGCYSSLISSWPHFFPNRPWLPYKSDHEQYAGNWQLISSNPTFTLRREAADGIICCRTFCRMLLDAMWPHTNL